MNKNRIMHGAILFLFAVFITSCIIPIPRKVEHHRDSKVLSYGKKEVLKFLIKILSDEGFTITLKNISAGSVGATKTGSVKEETFSVDTPKFTAFGMAMLIDRLTINATGVSLGKKKTRLTIDIDCKAEYAKKAVQTLFRRVEAKLDLEHYMDKKK